MANFTLPSPHQPRTSSQPLQEPRLDVLPQRANYNGAPIASDAGTLANVDAKPEYPGSGYPNQPITGPVR